jgi:LPS export ABC transporter protein LptC
VIYRLVVWLAGLTLLVGLVLLSGPQRGVVATGAAGAAAPDPGYAALGAHLVQTGADGQPLYSLDAARINQQPDDDTVRLTQVQMGFRAASGQEWKARAERGELGQDTGVVQLDGDVHVLGAIPGTQDQAEITTEHIAFDTHAQVVTTPDPVTLTMSGRELRAKGLVARLKEGHVELESGVHGSYLPQ